MYAHSDRGGTASSVGCHSDVFSLNYGVIFKLIPSKNNRPIIESLRCASVESCRERRNVKVGSLMLTKNTPMIS